MNYLVWLKDATTDPTKLDEATAFKSEAGYPRAAAEGFYADEYDVRKLEEYIEVYVKDLTTGKVTTWGIDLEEIEIHCTASQVT
jgi:hypothetical protein